MTLLTVDTATAALAFKDMNAIPVEALLAVGDATLKPWTDCWPRAVSMSTC